MSRLSYLINIEKRKGASNASALAIASLRLQMEKLKAKLAEDEQGEDDD